MAQKLDNEPQEQQRAHTQRQELKAELAKVRRVGYAISIEENEPGVCGIAAPIFDHLGHVVAAVNAAITGGNIQSLRSR